MAYMGKSQECRINGDHPPFFGRDCVPGSAIRKKVPSSTHYIGLAKTTLVCLNLASEPTSRHRPTHRGTITLNDGTSIGGNSSPSQA